MTLADLIWLAALIACCTYLVVAFVNHTLPKDDP